MSAKSKRVRQHAEERRLLWVAEARRLATAAIVADLRKVGSAYCNGLADRYERGEHTKEAT